MSDDEEDRKPKDRGLGRGLDALFGDDEDVFADYDVDEERPQETSRKLIGIENVFPKADQPRRFFDEVALKELAQSIEEYGLLQPILVRPDKTSDGMYEIVAGERRWRAAQKAQLHEIPVIIKELDDEETYQISLVENLQRKDLNPIEEAIGYQKLIDEFDHTAETVGEVLGKSRSHIANMIRILGLPSSVQAMVEVGDITMGHARALLSSDNAESVALSVIKNRLSVRETEKLMAEQAGRKIQSRSSKKDKKGFAQKDADTLALEKEVSDQIGMNVTVDMLNKNQGKMVIEFKNLDQLDDILQRLAQTPRY